MMISMTVPREVIKPKLIYSTVLLSYISSFDRISTAKKTKKRKEHKPRVVQPRVETYESLTRQHEELAIKLKEARRKLSRLTVAGIYFIYMLVITWRLPSLR